nr:ionotropic receptor 41b [Graphosoma rubrolineatum]
MRFHFIWLWFSSFCNKKCLSISIISINGTTINSYLEVLANEVANKYFSDHRCVVVMSDPGLLRNFKINTTVVRIEMNPAGENCVEEVANLLRITYRDNCDGYIIQSRNPSCAFDGWLDIYFHASVARHNPKYFFLPVYPDLLNYSDELLSRRESDQTSNFLVSELYENSTDWSVKISTNNFYLHPTVVGRDPKIYLDEWHYEIGFKENVDLYPDKVLDLRRKPFRIATAKYFPLCSSYPLDGSEVRISLYFCEKYNCTPQPVTDNALWGTIYENLSADGVLGNIYNDRADVGVLAVYLWLKEWYYIDYSTSYMFADVTVMLPKPKKLSAWFLPFLPFKSDVWIAFVISLFLSASSLYLITRASIKFTRFRDQLIKKVQFTTFEDSSMRAIGLAILQQPSSRLIGDSPNRYLFTSFEFLYLVLSAMYSAELASFLTVPLYYPPIDTFHDFAQSGIHWFATNLAWIFTLQGVDEEDAKLIVSHFEALSMDELKKKVKEGKYGFSVERMPGGSIGEQDYQTSEVIPMYHIMKEKLYGSPLVASIKKGSPYLKHFNEVVLKVVEHGHYLYWENEVARQYLGSSIQAAYEEAKTVHVDNSPAVIQVSNIQGVILIYAFGIIISIIVFFIEIMRNRKIKTSSFREKKKLVIYKNSIVNKSPSLQHFNLPCFYL